MKIFAKKDVWKKIVIVLLVIFSISFIEPIPVNAGVLQVGGKLMEPICDFLVGLADGWVGLMHEVLLHQHTALIKINTNEVYVQAIRVIITIVIALIIIAAICIATGGLGAIGAELASGAAISSAIGTTISKGAVMLALAGLRSFTYSFKVWFIYRNCSI